ncbi:hypothetical protein PVAND_012923 [Polypedilum vanderplanki]|uniref:Integrin alpha-PS2 n=1 Tax=Polypedilum vanderplanki TaxID=319348 RepID=A0A9J6CPY1_POLVA|nr:hypothetical protein PVAND_012923 [Polypedilum vanderplanki]
MSIILISGNNYNNQNEQIDTKSNQWFGATVTSAGIDGPLVACAPRYVYHQDRPKKVERIEPVGTCFIAKDNFREYQEFSPCRTMYWGYHRQGSCQAGLSATVNKAGDRLFIGAPGSWYWQGQTYSFSLNNPKDRVYATKESSSKEDDSYLGYSSITGDFNGDGTQGVAVGMPRGAGLLGKVLIFSWNLTNQLNITGEQIGAYFGYSLCSIDVDGDKLDDLIIGAPMFTEPNNEGKYETGRVYIVYQNKFNKFKELETREGTTSKGRFGLSLAALGDINLDGFGDFAVGAPYDGPNNRGAVYIFHGSRDGPLKKASQVIYAEDIVGSTLSTFGFSLSGGIDLDGNQYPDMVVGAYDSNLAIVLKSRAVAVMEASTDFESENKLISLDNKNCTIGRDRKQVTCTTVKSCLKYNGINLPASIDIEISWVLDSKKPKTPRMFFINDEGKNIRNSTMRLFRGKPECRTEAVYVSDGIRDKLTPLEVEMKYNIRQSTTSYSSTTVSRRRRAALEPVLDENRGTVQRDSINIMKNCGKDNICIPDLKLDIQTSDKYVLGGNESLNIDVTVNNHGEDAFEASFYMTVPQGLNFKSTKRIGEKTDTSFICTAPNPSTNYTLKCDIGNPLPAGKSVKFKAIFEPSKKSGITPFYDFYMEANSTNEEVEGGRFDNVFKKSVSISVESDLSIIGSSDPYEFHYNVSEYKSFENATNEGEIGPQVVHIYDIRNTGTSAIEEIELFINWPAYTLDEEPLMYLLNQPETQGNVVCEPTQFVNQHNLQIDRGLERKSYLDKNRAPIRTGERSSWSSSQSSSSSFSSSSGRGRYNTDGEATYEEKQILDYDSQEETGDASLVHKNRGKDSSHYERWGSEQGSSITIDRGRGSSATGVTSQTAQPSSGSRGNFNWESTQGSSSSGSRGGEARFESSSSRGSSYDARQGNRGSSYDSRGSSGSSFNTQSSSSRNTEREQSSSSGSRFGGNVGEGSKVREYEYHEQWNSTSENGGPAVTHFSSKNQTFNRGQDGGRILVSETSTETIITAGIGQQGASWNTRESSQSSSQHEYETDYEREQREREHYENQRRYQEEQRRRQIEERRRRIEEQKRADEERIRQEEERYRLEQERRYQEQSRVSGQQGGTTSFESSYSRQSGNRYGSGSSSGSGRSQSSQSSSSWGASSSNSGGSKIDSNVDQDISSLAARTHAEHSTDSSSTSSHSGRRRMMSQQDGEPPRPDLVTGVTTLEKVAQGGHGLQTVGLDLGILGGRNNVDDEIRRHESRISSGGAGSSSSSSHSTQFSSGSRTGSTGSSYSQHFSTNNDDEYEENEEEIYDEDGNDNDDQSHSGGTGHRSQSSYSYSYSSNSKNDPQFQHYRRTRDVNGLDKTKPLCQSAQCVNLRCVVGPLDKNTGALIALRTRLVAHTLHKIGGEREVRLSTMAIGNITKLPYVGTPANEILKTHEIFMTAIPDPIPKPDVIPLWVFILAACAGALILLLLIYLLYKCGFFKRNRPTGSPHERQPLNRNGNYHGDEHL